jgi:plasmid stability protein
MAIALQVSIDDQSMEKLRIQSQRHGKPVEQLAAEYLATMIAIEEDPLMQMAGAVESNVPDAALRHHEYLGQALYDELQGRSNP